MCARVLMFLFFVSHSCVCKRSRSYEGQPVIRTTIPRKCLSYIQAPCDDARVSLSCSQRGKLCARCLRFSCSVEVIKCNTTLLRISPCGGARGMSPRASCQENTRPRRLGCIRLITIVAHELCERLAFPNIYQAMLGTVDPTVSGMVFLVQRSEMAFLVQRAREVVNRTFSTSTSSPRGLSRWSR